MKTFRKTGLMAIAVFTAVSLASCGGGDNEDEPGTGGNITATLNGTAMNLSYAYWYIDKTSSTSSPDNVNMVMEFYSYNPTDPSSAQFPISYISVDYEVPASTSSISSKTIPSGSYHIYVAKDVSTTGSGWQAESIDGQTSNSPLVITRNGSETSVIIDHAEVAADDKPTNGDKPTTDISKTLALSYSGSIPMLPAEFRP